MSYIVLHNENAGGDFRRMRREARWGAVRAWVRWALHI